MILEAKTAFYQGQYHRISIDKVSAAEKIATELKKNHADQQAAAIRFSSSCYRAASVHCLFFEMAGVSKQGLN